MSICSFAGCYDVPVGFPTFQSSSPRVIARVFANGTFDTSLAFPHLFPNPNVFTAVASVDGVSGFWVSGSPYISLNGASPTPSAIGATVVDAGVLYVDQSGNPPTQVYNKYLPVTSLTIFNGNLFLTKGYVGYLGDQCVLFLIIVASLKYSPRYLLQTHDFGQTRRSLPADECQRWQLPDARLPIIRCSGLVRQPARRAGDLPRGSDWFGLHESVRCRMPTTSGSHRAVRTGLTAGITVCLRQLTIKYVSNSKVQLAAQARCCGTI